MKKEFGGYLPIELPHGEEYYRAGDGFLRRLNSGRAAIWYAVQCIAPRRIFVPYFYCPTVLEMLDASCGEIVRYHIAPDFSPMLDQACVESTDAVILVDYYGILKDTVARHAERYAHVIIDNSLAFYSKPRLSDGTFNIYSCRKFFGVPDGAYLIGAKGMDIDLPLDESYHRAGHLIKSIELGTHAAYQESLINEKSLEAGPRAMSRFTQRVLQSIDYEDVRARRRRNFLLLHTLLREIQKLDVDLSDCTPYCYPLLTDRSLRERLVAERIYCPTLWKECITPQFAGRVEYDYSERISCVPIDQRYDESDISDMAAMILRTWSSLER